MNYSTDNYCDLIHSTTTTAISTTNDSNPENNDRIDLNRTTRVTKIKSTDLVA